MERSIGQIIRRARLAKRLRITDLARQAGVSGSYLYAIEAGTRGAHIYKLGEIARVLGLRPSDSWPTDEFRADSSHSTR